MPDMERRKGQHLTLEDRQEIQRGLREHRTFKEIADIIGCSPDTVSKEIRNHKDVCLISIFIMRSMSTGNTGKNCVNPEKVLI